MRNMSLSRRQKNITTSSTAEDSTSVFDVESSTRDLSCLNISPTPPPPFLPTHRILPPKPEQTGRGPASYLRHVWKQYQSQASSSLDDEATAAAATAVACSASGHSHNRLAPASADEVYALEDSQQQQQQRRRRRRPQARKKLSQCSSGRGRGIWVRVKTNWWRISLVIVVGALAFDLHLACLESQSRAGEPSAKKGGLLSFLPPFLWNNQDSPDALFPDFPSNNDQFGSRSQLGVHADDEPKKYTRRRSRWKRGSNKGNGPTVTENDSPQIDTEHESRQIDDGVEIKPHEGRGATAAGAVVAAAAEVGVGHDEISPGDPWGAHVAPPPPPQHDPFHGQRVAVVVPYVGKDLPVWWDAFAEQARLNDGLIDWIIFCDQKLVKKSGPPNIKFFPMTTRRMAWLLAAVVEPHDPPHAPPAAGAAGGDSTNRRENDVVVEKDGHEIYDAVDSADSYEEGAAGGEPLAKKLATRKRAASFLHQLLITSPYFIVEFKPALGWLFREYLREYSHWAFGDLDVLFGNMRNGWLEPNELKDFDIITFSFGDQYRAYLRGQLTIHKNRSHVNLVWRRCSHLTSYSERLEEFRVNHGLPMESAEGCYSLAAASDPSLKIKFTVKALSDVDEEDEDFAAMEGTREVVVDGEGLVTLCPDLGDYDRPALAGIGGNHGTADPPTNMQDAVGPMVPVKRADTSGGSRCEHWIRPEHQTCVENVGARHTLFLVGGEYFKQEFINTAAATAGRDCRAGAFYHFQDHKRNYRTWNARPPVHPAHFGVAAGAGGIVPLPIAGWRERVSGQGLRPPAEYAEKVKHYCLGWTEQRQARAPDVGRPEQVCAVKVSSEEVVTVVDTRSPAAGINSQRRAPIGNAGSANDGGAGVTLASVGESQDLALFLSNAAEWEGPKIFAMALDADQLTSTRRLDVLTGAKYVRGGVLIVALLRPPPTPGMPRVAASFPEKALMNLVTDLCESRYLFSLPRQARLSPHAFQALDVRLRGNQRPRSPFPPPPKRKSGSSPVSSATGNSGYRSEDKVGISGPVTLVVPFDGTAAASQGGLGFEGRDSAPAVAPPPLAAAAEVGGVSDSDSRVKIHGNKDADNNNDRDDIAATFRGMDPTLTAAAVTAAEDAAQETGLALEHARVTLTAAKKAEEAAARAAVAAEGTATAANRAAAAAIAASAAASAVDAAAAAAAAATNQSGDGSETSYGASDANRNSRGDSTTFSGGHQGAVVHSGGGTLGSKGPKPLGGTGTGSPLQISFLTPTYGRPATPARSYGGGGGDAETMTPVEVEAMTSRPNSRRHHGHAVDTPGPSIVTQLHPPLSWLDERPRAQQQRSVQQAGQRQASPWRLSHHRAPGPNGNKARQGRGGWRGGGDAPATTTASASSSAVALAPLARTTGKAPSAATGVSGRRLSSTRRLRRGGEASWGSTAGSESGTAGAAAAAAEVEGQDEAEWVRSLLFSGPGTPGLVVDLWSPGPIFLRHVEEFGDSGCMDAAYALGLWRAGSSFEVVEDATLSSTAPPSSTFQGDVYGASRRAFTSERVMGSKFHVPGGGCLRNEVVANTASIYSAFLLQVANVYRRPWSEIAARHDNLDYRNP